MVIGQLIRRTEEVYTHTHTQMPRCLDSTFVIAPIETIEQIKALIVLPHCSGHGAKTSLDRFLILTDSSSAGTQLANGTQNQKMHFPHFPVPRL